MRGHTGAEIEGYAVEMIAAAGGTIRSALLQAGDMRVAIIPAARALGEIAAERREMTDLRGCETLRGGGEARIGGGDAGVGGDRGDAGEGPDAHRAICAPLHPDGVGRCRKIDQRPMRKPAAPP